MNFLGLGPGEMMLILVLALIIVGPQKLPEMATQIGKTIRDFRRSTTEISAEFQRSFSLEEQAQPERVGPAAVFASNGVAGAEAPTEGASEPVAAQSNTPLTDTSNWAWETSPEATVQSGAATSSGSFWEWDSQSEAVAQVGEAGETGASRGQVERAPEAGSAWEWDTGEAPGASSSEVMEAVPAASVAELPADGVAPSGQAAAAEPESGERKARRLGADDGAAAATSKREEPVT
jgi:TatA/E family protein of Tat protein translocase